jgi:hypothetical protein
MPAEDSLKRLGGGRWETRDGRFAIEPQSGTWVVVDNTQTDDLGLPLVRGPFGSLTAAKEAIENARSTGPAESPLAGKLKQAKAATGKARASTERSTPSRAAKPSAGEAPEAPPEPKWLRDLEPTRRRRARELIERLEKLDVDKPEEIARAEIVRDQPAVTRLALERSIRKAIASARSPAGAARAAVEVILGGRDADLGARWRLVDEQGRRLDELDLSD